MSIVWHIIASLQQSPHKIAVYDWRKENDCEAWIPISHETFLNHLTWMTLALFEHGVREGTRVALLGQNSVQWLLMDLAILACGGISVPLYPSLLPENIHPILEECTPHLVAVDGPERHKIPPSFPTLLFYGQETDSFTFEAFLKRGQEISLKNPTQFEDVLKSVTAKHLAIISYTSGTSGHCKGVMLTHENICHSIFAPFPTAFHFQNRQEEDTVLSFLPMSHILEHVVVYHYLVFGFPLYLCPDPHHFLPHLATARPVHMTAVPRVLERIFHRIEEAFEKKAFCLRWLGKKALAHAQTFRPQSGYETRLLTRLYDFLFYKKFRQKMGGRLRGLSVGGAPLAPWLMAFFNGIGIPCGQGYGMTETSPLISMYDITHNKIGSVGKPVAGIEVKCASDGEIWVKGPNVMAGYYKNPPETARILRPDGWLATGDIGYFDEEGFLFITDRKKDLFKLTTGKYISPSLLETALSKYSLIQQCLILGEGKSYVGALLWLCPSESKRCPEALHQAINHILSSVNKNLPPWERIRLFTVMEETPTIENGLLTPSLKKKRGRILSEYASHIEKMYHRP